MKISVIIPAYNAEKYMNKCFDSLLNQTSKDFEVICINDGSTDDTLKKLNEYAKVMNNLKIISKENEGAGIARNEGMKYAQGKYTLFLDSDDYLESDAIEKLIQIAEKNNIDFLFYNFIQEGENGKIIKRFNFSNYKNCTKSELIQYMLMGTLPFGQHHLLKTNIYKLNDFKYSTNTKVCEELVFKIKCLNTSSKIYFSDYVPYHYVKHLGSLSKNIDYFFDLFKKREQMIKEIETILKENVEDDNRYQVLINTYNIKETILLSYGICKNNKINFKDKYQKINKYRNEELYDKNNKLKSINFNLFTKKYKILYNIFKYKFLTVFYILFLKTYRAYDTFRQKKY